MGIVWSAIVVAGFRKNSLSVAGHSGQDELAGFLLILGWVGAVATSFSIRGTYERLMTSPLLAATEAGETQLHDRRRALEIARDKPALARQIGVGRPDQPGAFDAGLVDVNNASVTALQHVPGIDERIAARIIEVRAESGGSPRSRSSGWCWTSPATWSSGYATASCSCRVSVGDSAASASYRNQAIK